MSSSFLLRFLVTATFYSVEMDEVNRKTTWMRRRVDSKWWWRHGGREVEIGEKEKKKRSPACVAVYAVVPIHRPYIVCIYIYTIVFDRRVFPNGRLLETHCYIYLRIYIIYIPYTATISTAMYILYIYIVNRITVLISFSVSLALYNRHSRGEECTCSAAYIYIYISSVETIVYVFFLFFSHQPFPLSHRHIAIATPFRTSRYRDTALLFSPLYSARQFY